MIEFFRIWVFIDTYVSEVQLTKWCCFDRKKRLAEMREAVKISKYGSVMPISGSDFVREVSQAPQDVWVVVILYKEGY